MFYGDYQFDPVPMLSFSREYRKTDDGRILNSVGKMSLEGTLVTRPTNSGGINNLIQLKDALSSGLNTQGCTFLLKCNDQVLINNNPRLNSLQFRNSTNNWLDSVGYTIELEYPDSVTGEVSGTEYIDTISENWSIENVDDHPYFYWTTSAGTESSPYLYKITHKISAKGRANYAACGTLMGSGAPEPWENARTFCEAHLGTSGDMNNLMKTPLTNLTAYHLYNYNRVQNLDKYAGSYSVDENWLLFKSNTGVPGYALENFTVDIKQGNTTNITTVGIQGSIQGLEKVSYSDIDIINKTVTETKFGNAEAYWSAIQGRLLARAQEAYSIALPTEQRQLNIVQVNKSVGVNPPNGTINYGYEWTNNPAPCIEGAVSESITFDYSFPTDKFASIDILGRGNGPIIQLMNSRTPYEVSVNIDVVVLPETGCIFANWALTSSSCPHAKVKALLSTIESSLGGSYTTLVKTADKPNWNPKQGVYRRSVTWLYNNCTETATTVAALP